MNKKAAFFALLITSFLIIVPTVSAQFKSNSVITRVGEAPMDQKPGGGGGTPGGPRPEAPDPGPNVRAAIIEKFGITLNGFSDQYLRYAWEKFWEVSNTNFISLVKGSVINITSPANTQQVGCGAPASVLLGQFGDGNQWKHVLIHELGHVVRNCNNASTIQRQEHINAFNSEKGVSDYGNKAPSCTGSDNLSEDYAEMIAYYLNPGYKVSTVRCFPAQNPDMETNFPKHFEVARKVLGVY